MLKKSLVGLALCLALPLAHADKGSLRYSNLQVSLEDLDTTDSYQPDQEGVDRLLGNWPDGAGSGGYILGGGQLASLNPPAGVTRDSFSAAGARGDLSADGSTGTLQSSIDVSNPTSYQSFLFALGNSEDPAEIALAPHTRLTVSIDTEATGEITAKCWAGKRCSSWDISPALWLNVWTASGEAGSLFANPWDYYEVTLSNETVTSFSRFEQLSITFENNTDGWLYATPYSSFHFVGAVAAVPEPQTWALTLAGLAALGGVARRRRQQG
ncbi:PEP-CTERM sorting domain-containing protein [Caldimonas brevitalea]|uniref:Ice-binding protein C-terminal domain-containing protein n=1 Tax=Caldimonas brevitalea TaxID=413882 RepID=A0A0G3BX58_9BURK|nr:PEP-CTERM sorting domain-containing protein [Caldimonas brevitalea]AKJ31951.1 hypothetical protein AAW51_5260 [Caldimonas brevitalea]